MHVGTSAWRTEVANRNPEGGTVEAGDSEIRDSAQGVHVGDGKCGTLKCRGWRWGESGFREAATAFAAAEARIVGVHAGTPARSAEVANAEG